MSSTVDVPAQHSRFAVEGWLLWLQVAMGLSFIAVAPLFPLIIDDYGIDNATTSLLIGVGELVFAHQFLDISPPLHGVGVSRLLTPPRFEQRLDGATAARALSDEFSAGARSSPRRTAPQKCPGDRRRATREQNEAGHRESRGQKSGAGRCCDEGESECDGLAARSTAGRFRPRRDSGRRGEIEFLQLDLQFLDRRARGFGRVGTRSPGVQSGGHLPGELVVSRDWRRRPRGKSHL